MCVVCMQGLHIGTRELEEMGRKFSEALSKIKSRHAKPATKITPSGSTGANLDIQPNTDGFSSSPGGSVPKILPAPLSAVTNSCKLYS